MKQTLRLGLSTSRSLLASSVREMSSSLLRDTAIGALPLASGNMSLSVQAEFKDLGVTEHVTVSKRVLCSAAMTICVFTFGLQMHVQID